MTESDDDADASVHDPQVTGAPDAIWLIYGDIERDSTHAECCVSGEVLWCDEAQFAADVRYTRTDLLAERVRAAVAAERERCASKCRRPVGWLSDAQQQIVDDIRRAIEFGAERRDNRETATMKDHTHPRPAAGSPVDCEVGRLGPKRETLPSDMSRCHGDNGANAGARCHDCARREQLQHDDETRWFPVMFARPRADGSCPYWLREVYA